MPEGDTVYRAARRLHDALAGATLLKTDFRVPRFATTDLSGRRVEEVAARGKHIFFRLSGGVSIHSHFKMDGSWHLYRDGERWHRPSWQARAVITVEDWIAVAFLMPVLEVFPTVQEAQILSRLGPDPLAADWDPREAQRRLTADPGRTVSAAILDQTTIAGLGNVYRCEICFLTGLDPWTPVASIAAPAQVVDLAKRLMFANKDRATRITTGDPRRGHALWVYGRAGKPCRRCRTKIRRREADTSPDGERLTFWCPSCQPSHPGGRVED